MREGQYVRSFGMGEEGLYESVAEGVDSLRATYTSHDCDEFEMPPRVLNFAVLEKNVWRRTPRNLFLANGDISQFEAQALTLKASQLRPVSRQPTLPPFSTHEMSYMTQFLSRASRYNYQFLLSSPYWINIFFLAHFCQTRIGTIHGCAGPSMLPTLSVRGDLVYCSRYYRRGRGIKVGDVIEIRHPMMPEAGAIKRVVGMPGDFVLRDPLVEEIPGEGGGMLQVPEGHCWIIGDNVGSSRDSRFYGPIPLALVQGKVTRKLWPWGERKRIENNLKRVEEG